MHISLDVLRPWVELAGVLIGGIIALRLGPKDHDRAQHLATLAQGIAGAMVASQPNATWSTLLQTTVNAISKNATTPTTNAEVIRRAAVAALMALGKKPA